MAPETLSVPEAARCKTCGYALRGLGDPRCPECGGAFDPDDPTTYTEECPKGVLDNRWTILLPCCIIGVVGNLLLGIPIRALVLFPSWLCSDSAFHRHRSVWLLLTVAAFVLVLAHPVHPARQFAAITVLGAIAWYLLAAVTFVVAAGAAV